MSLFLSELLHDKFLTPSLPFPSNGHPHRGGSLLKVSAFFTHYVTMLHLESKREMWQRFMNWYDGNLDLFDKRKRGIGKDLLAEQQNGSWGIMEGLTSHDLVENSDYSDNGIEKTFFHYWTGFSELKQISACPSRSDVIKCTFGSEIFSRIVSGLYSSNIS